MEKNVTYVCNNFFLGVSAWNILFPFLNPFMTILERDIEKRKLEKRICTCKTSLHNSMASYKTYPSQVAWQESHQSAGLRWPPKTGQWLISLVNYDLLCISFIWTQHLSNFSCYNPFHRNFRATDLSKMLQLKKKNKDSLGTTQIKCLPNKLRASKHQTPLQLQRQLSYPEAST